MDFRFSLDIMVYCFSAFLSLGYPVYLISKLKMHPLLYSLLAILTLIPLGVAYPIVTFRPFERVWFYVYIEYMSAWFIGWNWLLFSIYYTKNENRIKFCLILSALLLLGSYGFMIRNDIEYQRFFPIIPGPTYLYSTNVYINGMPLWVHYLTLLAFFLFGSVFLFKRRILRGHGEKKNILLMFLSTIPFVTNILPAIGSDLLHKDMIYRSPSSIVIGTATMIFFLGVIIYFRYNLLNIIPLSLRNLVDNTNVMMILVNTDNEILDFNKALLKNFDDDDSIRRNSPMTTIIANIRARISDAPDNELVIEALCSPKVTDFNSEINLCHPQHRSFTVNIQPIYLVKQELLGRIITINDITEYRELVEEINRKNNELVKLNNELREYASTVEELAVEKERIRVARDVHDTLGHTLTTLIALLELGKAEMKLDPESSLNRLNKSITIARKGLDEVSRSIHGLISKETEAHRLNVVVKNIVSDFQTSGLNVDCKFDGREIPCNQEQIDAIYRVCQEALTNAVRHGKAQHATILLRFETNGIKLFIFDDGAGCANPVKGMGLAGMEERIKALGGTFSYGSDGERGFNILAEIPVGV